MIRNILGVLIMAAFIVGGGYAASLLKPPAGPIVISERVVAAGEAAVADVDMPAVTSKDTPGRNEESDSNAGHGADGNLVKPGSHAYYKFSRQFLVPVINAGDVQSLVIIDLNLEVDPGRTEDIFAMEPKVRDVLMTELLALSNEGRFETRLTDPVNYAEIRARLLAAVHSVIREGVHAVLILDIARQDS